MKQYKFAGKSAGPMYMVTGYKEPPSLRNAFAHWYENGTMLFSGPDRKFYVDGGVVRRDLPVYDFFQSGDRVWCESGYPHPGGELAGAFVSFD